MNTIYLPIRLCYLRFIPLISNMKYNYFCGHAGKSSMMREKLIHKYHYVLKVMENNKTNDFYIDMLQRYVMD